MKPLRTQLLNASQASNNLTKSMLVTALACSSLLACSKTPDTAYNKASQATLIQENTTQEHTIQTNKPIKENTMTNSIINNDSATINDGITSKAVSFNSGDNTLVGNLILPADYDSNKKLPAIIVTGAWTTVKEQMPSTYAKELARQGFATLVFDFTGWGESAGKKRYVEDPQQKIADIKSASDFLKTQPEINPEQVGGLGVCASSGYMVKAYTDGALKSLALVAPWLHNQEIATAVYGGEGSVKNLLAASDTADKKFADTGEMEIITAASTTDDQSLMYQAPYYTEADRGLIKAFDNQFNLASWRPWLTFDAIQYADKLPNQVLFVESEDMALPQGSAAFKAIAGDNVVSVNLPETSQFDFYDQVEPVAKSVASVAEFMTETL